MIDIKKVSWWEWLLVAWLLFDIVSVSYYFLTQHGTPETTGRYLGSVMYKWVFIGIGYYLFVYRVHHEKNILKGR
jgi:hypothetical protein